MTALFPARRSAQRFDALVEGGRPEDADRSSADLLELVGALRSLPEAQARPAFVADLRERLMLAAETELVAAPAQVRDDVARLTITPGTGRRQRRIGIAVTAAAIIGATTSMAVASQSALPGDALYPIKRGIENAQAGFSVGDDAKGETILGNASTRLDEVDKLTHKKKPDAKLVTNTLDEFTEQFTDGSNALLADYETTGNASSIQQIHHIAASSIDLLAGLPVPPAAHDALVNAAHTVFAIDSSAMNLCPDPDCGEGLLEMPANLANGVVGQVTDTLDNVAGGELPGTAPSTEPSTSPQHNGGKGHQPSGLNPPETPIELPSATTDGLGGLLGGSGSDTQGTDNTGNTDNSGTDDNGDGNGGKGGKGGKGTPVDLAPITDTVNQVVTGVVEGVNGVLAGLTGSGS